MGIDLEDVKKLHEAAEQQMAKEGVTEMFFTSENGICRRERADILEKDKESAGESLFSVRNPKQIINLLNAGANINECSKFAETVLIRLVLRSAEGQIEDVLTCAKLMKDAGVRFDWCDVFEDTALGLALKTGQWKLAKFLSDSYDGLSHLDATLPCGKEVYEDVFDSVFGKNWTREDVVKACNQIYDEENWLLPQNELKKVHFVRWLIEINMLREELAKVAITKKRLKEKQQNKKQMVGVSGVVFADILAEKINSGEIKGDITPDMTKKLYTKYVRNQMLIQGK